MKRRIFSKWFLLVVLYVAFVSAGISLLIGFGYVEKHPELFELEVKQQE